jgi:hypothetical protein
MDAGTQARPVHAGGPAPAAEVPDFRSFFEASPGLCLVLRADAPRFTIVAVSDA